MSYWVRHDPERGTLEPDHGRRPWSGPVSPGTAARRGLVTFLLPLTSMFALVISTYLIRRHGVDWQSVTLPWQVWLSTALLIGSSAAFEKARKAAGLGRIRHIRPGLVTAGVLALAFLGSQLWGWVNLQEQGYHLGTTPASSFFYLMSGLHALHLVGGLVAWFRTRSALSGDVETKTVQQHIQLCAIYWHFLLAVWLVLLGVLVWAD